MYLADYEPRSMLVNGQHHVSQPRFTAVDAHSHLGRWRTADLDWRCPNVSDLLGILDACNIRTICNLDGMWGAELEANLD